MGLFDSKTAARLAATDKKLGELRQELDRTNYTMDRVDAWLDMFMEGIARELNIQVTNAKASRWNASAVLGQGVASVEVHARSHEMVFKSLMYGDYVPPFTIVLDDDPNYDDITPWQMSDLEAWYRYASTGQQFDSAAAAATINALGR